MRINLLLLNCLTLLSGLAALPAAADVSLRIADNEGVESRLYVSAGRCRFEAEGMTGYAVIDTGAHAVAYVDPGKGEYSTMSETELRAQLDKVNQVRESIAPHMDSLRGGLQLLSPEQRAMFEQFMQGKAAPAAGTPVKLVADRGMQRFAGIACTHHRLVQNGREVGEACLLQRPDGPVSATDFRTLDTVLGLLREISGSATGLLAQAGNKTALLGPDARGIPIALRDFSTGESYRVVAASARSLDGQLFNDFRNYRKVDAPALPGLF